MKCLSCKINIPPTYAKALMDNLCPACGKDILSATDFKELLRVKTLLQDLELEENVVVSVSAAISQKYDLVVKGRAKAMTTPTPEEIEATEGLSDEERMRLRALHAAQQAKKTKEEEEIVEAWGLKSGEFSAGVVKTGRKNLGDPAMAGLFDGLEIEDEVAPALSGSGYNPGGGRNTERMARAEALRSDPGRFKINRAE